MAGENSLSHKLRYQHCYQGEKVKISRQLKGATTYSSELDVARLKISAVKTGGGIYYAASAGWNFLVKWYATATLNLPQEPSLVDASWTGWKSGQMDLCGTDNGDPLLDLPWQKLLRHNLTVSVVVELPMQVFLCGRRVSKSTTGRQARINALVSGRLSVLTRAAG
ncbi:hypothetical protein LAD67_16970 [Escherichia coli]|nr:hypothetical protein [Escherichia coli]